MKSVLTASLLLLSLAITAQDKIADLKKQISQSTRQDSNFLKLQLGLAAGYLNQQTDSALKYSLSSVSLAEKLKLRASTLKGLDFLGQAYYNKGRLREGLLTFQKQENLASSEKEKAQSIRNQGNIYIEMGKPELAIASYKKAMEKARLAQDEITRAMCLSNISYVLRQQGKYDEAYKYQIEALKIGEKLKDNNLIAKTQIQLALMQYSRKQWDDARNFSENSLKIYQNSKNMPGTAIAYTILGGVASEKNDFVAAKRYITEAYKINLGLADNRQIGNSAHDLAEIDLSLKDYVSALKSANSSIEYLEKASAVNNLSTAYTSRGKIYTAQKEFDKAERDILKGLQLSRSGSFKEAEKKALEALALLKSAKGDFGEAFSAQVKLNALKDSMFNADNSRQINELRTIYETEKKEQAITLLNARTNLQQLDLTNQQLELETKELALSNKDLDISNKDLQILQKETAIRQKMLEGRQQKQQITTLNQQSTIQKLQIKQRNISLIVAAVLLIFSLSTAYFIYNRRKLKARAELQEEINKQQDLAARAVLDAEERERRRIAGDLHDGVGQMLSAALMNLNGLFQKIRLSGEESLQAEQTLALVNESYDEMRTISHQMMPNALIKAGLAQAVKEFLNKIDKNKIKVVLETQGLNERLDEQTETVLYRVIQETVTNVIKHSGANKLNIQLIRDEEGTSVTVEDNGKGFDKNKIDIKAGIGLSNIYSRVEFLKGSVDIDTSVNKGTLVVIFVPNSPAS